MQGRMESTQKSNGVYSLVKRLAWMIFALSLGVIIAGFWNYQAVDGFGRNVVAGQLLGDTGKLSGQFAENGVGFGMIFAWVAGLSATFTACNCVIYAMLPGLACPVDGKSGRRELSKSAALNSLGIFTLGVIAVCAFYGVYVGIMGTEGVQAFNSRTVRLQQAEVTFTLIGAAMLIWGMISFGFFKRITASLPAKTRVFFAKPSVKAGLMGLMSGFFTIGRPYPVFRDFLAFAAASENPIYGAVVMSIQGLGQIAVMVVLFFILLAMFGKPLVRWTLVKPHQAELLTAVSFFTGGAYFVYYWGLAIPFDIGNWGFKLGLY